MKSRKSLSCGTRCIKYMLIAFNVIFLVSSAGYTLCFPDCQFLFLFMHVSVLILPFPISAIAMSLLFSHDLHVAYVCYVLFNKYSILSLTRESHWLSMIFDINGKETLNTKYRGIKCVVTVERCVFIFSWKAFSGRMLFFIAKPALNIIYIQFYRISALTTLRKMILGKTRNGADTTFTLHGRADPCTV